MASKVQIKKPAVKKINKKPKIAKKTTQFTMGFSIIFT